jgi:hypothetical protein
MLDELITELSCSALESATDELLIDVQDVTGALQGRCGIPLSSLNDDPVSALPLWDCRAVSSLRCFFHDCLHNSNKIQNCGTKGTR